MKHRQLLASHRIGLFTSLVLAVLASCSSGTTERESVTDWFEFDMPPLDEPAPELLFSGWASGAFEETGIRDLDELLPADTHLAGVAANPRNGQIWILAAEQGIYELHEDRAELIFSLQNSLSLDSTGQQQEPPQELTDIAFQQTDNDDGRLVVIAENDGFALTIGTNTLMSYFCYFPRTDPEGPLDEILTVSQEMRRDGIDVTERSEAVAVDFQTGAIYAQPQTRRLDTGDAVGSELFQFDVQGGDSPLAFRRFEDDTVLAGGMIVLRGIELLGQGDSIYSQPGIPTMQLPGIDNITGMAPIDSFLEPQRAHVLVLDGPGRKLHSITLGQPAPSD